jgi:ATP-dependent Lon protease
MRGKESDDIDKLSPKARKVFAQMKEAEWKELRNRLLYFAHKSYARSHRISGDHLDEVIQDSIVDVLTGTRRWPPVDEDGNERDVDLLVFLCQTIRSKVSHIIEKSYRELYVGDNLDLITDELTHEHRHLIRKNDEVEQQAIYNELSRKLLKTVADDSILKQIVELLIKTPDLRPKEIALLLGLTMEEMRNAQKRLNRKARTLKVDKNNG